MGGQVPVEQRGVGGDAFARELVEQALVEIKPGRDGLALGVADPRPGDGEAVVLESQVGHQGHIFAHAVHMVTSDQAVAAVLDVARGLAEGIPDAGQFAAFSGSAFDLEGRGRAAPFKGGGEALG